MSTSGFVPSQDLKKLASQMGIATTGLSKDQLAKRINATIKGRSSNYRLYSPPATMVSPPTVTVLGPGGDTALPGSTSFPYNQTGMWRFGGLYGELLSQFGTDYWRNRTNQGRNASNAVETSTPTPYSAEFVFSGQKFQVQVRAGSTTGHFRLMVDGQVLSTPVHTKTDYSPGSLYRIEVDFGARVTKRIRMDLNLLDWGGMNVLPTDSVFPPAYDQGPKVQWLGDSFGYGAGATSPLTGMAQQLAEIMGWANFYNSSEGGTGFLNPGSSAQSQTHFLDRVTLDVAPIAPDILILAGGTNDSTLDSASYTTSALQTRVTQTIQAVQAILPNTQIIGVTAWVPGNAASNTARAAAGAAVKAAFDAAGLPVVDTTGWVTGTGKVGSPAGNGTADVITSSDGIHPSQEGHDFYAQRLVAAIAPILGL